MRTTTQHLNSHLHATWKELDAMVVMAMQHADATGDGCGRSRLIKSGLLDPALKMLWHARTHHKFKGCTASVLDAAMTRGIAA